MIYFYTFTYAEQMARQNVGYDEVCRLITYLTSRTKVLLHALKKANVPSAIVTQEESVTSYNSSWHKISSTLQCRYSNTMLDTTYCVRYILIYTTFRELDPLTSSNSVRKVPGSFPLSQ